MRVQGKLAVSEGASDSCTCVHSTQRGAVGDAVTGLSPDTLFLPRHRLDRLASGVPIAVHGFLLGPFSPIPVSIFHNFHPFFFYFYLEKFVL